MVTESLENLKFALLEDDEKTCTAKKINEL